MPRSAATAPHSHQRNYNSSNNNYAVAVTSLRTSLVHLNDAVGSLTAAADDWPRMAGILRSVRHYELIPQPTLAAAEASLRDEIGPSIAVLLARATRLLERVQRHVDQLKARSELNQGRIAATATSTPKARAEEAGAVGRRKSVAVGGGIGGVTGTLGPEGRLKVKCLRQKRAQLEYGVQRLEQEVAQKERELRKKLERR